MPKKPEIPVPVTVIKQEKINIEKTGKPPIQPHDNQIIEKSHTVINRMETEIKETKRPPEYMSFREFDKSDLRTLTKKRISELGFNKDVSEMEHAEIKEVEKKIESQREISSIFIRRPC